MKNKVLMGLGILVLVLVMPGCCPVCPEPQPCPPCPTCADTSALETQLGACEATLAAISEKGPPPPPPETKCGVPEAILWSDAARYEGETIVVYGPVVDSHFASTSSGQPTFLNLGKQHPDPGRFTVLIWGDERQAFIDTFGGPPEDVFLHRDVCARGLIEYYEGTHEIILRIPDNIWFQ